MIPALNRDGDILSDLVLPLFGSIAGSESLLVAFDEDYVPTVVLAEAAHGTAPSLKGKNVANPMAMILAGAALLVLRAARRRRHAARAIREACLEAVAEGVRTADLGGHAATSEFTDEVIRAHALEARGLVDALSYGRRPRSRAAPPRRRPRGRPRRSRGRTACPRSARPRRRASSWLSARRYGRSLVIASNASATASTRASTGICSPERPVG